MGVKNRSFASVLNIGKGNPSKVIDSSPTIVLDDECLIERDFSDFLICEIQNISMHFISKPLLNPLQRGENFINDFELDNEKELDHVSETSFKHENNMVYNQASKCSEQPLYFDDPFGFTPDLGKENVKEVNSARVSQPKEDLNAEQEALLSHLQCDKGSYLWVILVDLNDKRMLWEFLGHMIDTWDGECVLLGDFNEMHSIKERHGTVFKANGANAFNNFITMTGLVDLPLEGYPLTWSHKLASKMSKLDRFLISALKTSIKQWIKDEKLCSNSTMMSILKRLSELDKLFDLGRCNEELVSERSKLLKELHDINSTASSDMFQKAKIHWAIEGDENSKYFHGIINKKRSQFAIRGVLVEGDWIVEPSNLADLERDVTHEEIKKAVWDCGINKSPNPDGFTFEVFRRYWKIIDNDMVVVVLQLFSSGILPPGCNSSFIALIPKT
ncbi:RNA-directed DNA polymerase, eukaryota [Tanacetum coccineum]